jgi:hypothetical protein
MRPSQRRRLGWRRSWSGWRSLSGPGSLGRGRLVERRRCGFRAELAQSYDPDLHVVQLLGRVLEFLGLCLLQLLGFWKGSQGRRHTGPHPISRLMTSASFWPAGCNTGLVT